MTRDQLICQMRKEGHTCREIRTALIARNEGLSEVRIREICRQNGVLFPQDKRKFGGTDKSAAQFKRFLAISPAKPTVKSPDSYMRQVFAGRLYTDDPRCSQ